jgi:hypothetical protein
LIETSGKNSFGNYHSGIDRVDSDVARPELFRECSCDRIDRSLGCVVNHRRGRSEGAGERTNVNDGAALLIKMLQRLLSDEKRPQNIGIEHAVELFFRHIFERNELINASVVHKDVNLAERFFRLRK